MKKGKCCCLPSFFKINLFQNILSETLSQLSNSLDPDQDRHSVEPDVGPIRLQRLSHLLLI